MERYELENLRNRAEGNLVGIEHLVHELRETADRLDLRDYQHMQDSLIYTVRSFLSQVNAAYEAKKRSIEEAEAEEVE